MGLSRFYEIVFFFNINVFIYFWLHWVFVAEHGLFSSYGEQGLRFIVVASFVAEHGLQAHGLSSCGAQACYSAACGIFPDQGSNPCPLHWQVDS